MEALLLAFLAPFVILGVVALGFVLNLLFAWPLMYAWNYVVPGLFTSMHQLTYWQAFALLVVSSLLVKSTSTSTSGK